VFAAKWKVSLFEALFAESLPTALPRKAVDALHEFGRFANDLEYRARQSQGAQAARAWLMDWLKAIGYEQHLHDGEERAKLAEARWTNVLDFVDWIARRCGGEVAADGSGTVGEAASVMQVAQTISLMQSMAERGDDADVVTLSTLHAAKGLEWPHVMLAGVNEGLLPFRQGDGSGDSGPVTAQRLEEERRLMYVGVTRARQTLMLSALKRRKRGRDTVAAMPSRFIAEMKLDEASTREDPREKLKRLRAALAARSAAPVDPAARSAAPVDPAARSAAEPVEPAA
jgi:ATP-dependent DNA helicase Rep